MRTAFVGPVSECADHDREEVLYRLPGLSLSCWPFLMLVLFSAFALVFLEMSRQDLITLSSGLGQADPLSRQDKLSFWSMIIRSYYADPTAMARFWYLRYLGMNNWFSRPVLSVLFECFWGGMLTFLSWRTVKLTTSGPHSMDVKGRDLLISVSDRKVRASVRALDRIDSIIPICMIISIPLAVQFVGFSLPFMMGGAGVSMVSRCTFPCLILRHAIASVQTETEARVLREIRRRDRLVCALLLGLIICLGCCILRAYP